MSPSDQESPAASPQQVSWRETPVKRLLFGPVSPEDFEDPEKQLSQLRERKKELDVYRRLSIGLGGVLLFIALLGSFIWDPTISVVSGALGLLAFALATLFSTGDIELQIRDLDFELDVLERLKGSRERAYKLFKAHQLELRRYYNLARRHSWIMLAAGLLCIAFGVAIIVAAGWIILHPPPGLQGDVHKVIVGVLGAVGGILVNYVAAVYLKMYAATSQALNDFHNRLVSTHHLHFGNYLASKIDDKALRYETFKAMAVELAKQ